MAQGIVRRTVTDRSGLYSIPDLLVGLWDLRVLQPGFAVRELKNVTLQAVRSSTVDVELTHADLAKSEAAVTAAERALGEKQYQ